MIPQDIKDMTDEELNEEISRLEQIEAERIEAMAALVVNLLHRVNALEVKCLNT